MGAGQAWATEPDKIDFVDEATSLPCAMRRGPAGQWNGYIGIPDDHPWHGKDYSYRQPMPEGWMDGYEASIDDLGLINVLCSSLSEDRNNPELTLLVRCHGGLTYAGRGEFIGSEAASWWFGFDCAHSDDLCPKYADQGGSLAEGEYRDEAFVRAALAKACSDIAKFSIDAAFAIIRDDLREGGSCR